MKGRSRRGAQPPPRKANKTPAAPRALADALAQRLALAVSRHQQGRLAEAEADYRAILATEPKQSDALNLLGVICLQTARAAEAVELLTAAVGQDALSANYQDNLGSALAAVGRIGEAAGAHLRAVRLKADFASAWFNLANALSGAGRPDVAVKALRAAIVLKPDYLKAWFNAGNAFISAGLHRQAAIAFARAVKLAPEMAEAHTNLSDALSAIGDLEDALHHQRVAVAMRPDDATARYNLGVVLQQSGRYEQAELTYRDALRRRADHYGAWNNLGGVMRRLRQPQKAAMCHRMALIFRPDFLEAYYNLGNALHRMGRLAEAAAIYERVLARNPDLATATHNLGMLSLVHGDMARGWEGYEKRFAALEAVPNRRPPVPRWNGEPLNGRTLLVWREQGVGDEFMFSSCYNDLAALGGHVVVECDRRLTSLFARSFPKFVVRAESCDSEGRETADFKNVHFHCPAGSLPRLLRRRIGDFPSSSRWLEPDPVKVARWRTRVNALGRGLKIGVCWSSQLGGDERDAAYTALADWAPLFNIPGVQIVSLQYHDCEAEILEAEERFNRRIHRWDDLDLKDDFDATSALISNLDLVVTVGTSVGELAAALGTPTWRFGSPGDWSALGAACRPWFSAMRLWRSQNGESLRDVLIRIASEIKFLRDGLDQKETLPGPSLFETAVRTHQLGRFADAIALYRRTLADDPAHADAIHLFGLCHHQSDASDRAIKLIRRAIFIDPDFPFAENNLGLVYQQIKNDALAKKAFIRALILRPDFAEAASHLGLIYQHAKKYNNAIFWHQRAVRVAPLHGGFHTNHGAALERAERFGDAEKAYRRALAVEPGRLPDALNNIGMARRQQGDLGSAQAWMQRALLVQPSFALAAWNIGLLELGRGDFAKGWRGYERRFQAETLQPPRLIPLPLWRGEPLNGRRLLVWDEQGVGDEILFASCLDELESSGGQIVVECDRRLVSLFARAFPWAEVRASEGLPGGPEKRIPPDCDLQVPIGSLPALTRRRLSDFPATRQAYLGSEPALAALWRDRLKALPPGLRVGVAWTSQVIDAYRKPSYMNVDDFAPVLALRETQGVCLQYGDHDAAIRRFEASCGLRLHRWADLDLKDDFESLAALIVNLDLVICPASSVGELAAALGTPTWRICPSDWTQFGAAARPWFPSMKVLSPLPGESVAGTLPRAARLLAAARQSDAYS